MNRLTFNKMITTRLGGNLIDVELDFTDIDEAYNNAVLTFRTKGQDDLYRDFYALSVTADNTTYTIPSNIGVDQVTRVIQPNTSAFSSNDPFDLAVASALGSELTSATTGTLLGFELVTQLIEYYERYTAHEVQFIYRRSSGQITLLRPPRNTEVWYLDVYRRSTDDEYRDMLWIQEWTMAECKIILGLAYRKFSSLASPAGDAALAGSELVQEGRDDKERLLKDIVNLVSSPEPVGSPIMLG